MRIIKKGRYIEEPTRYIIKSCGTCGTIFEFTEEEMKKENEGRLIVGGIVYSMRCPICGILCPIKVEDFIDKEAKSK